MRNTSKERAAIDRRVMPLRRAYADEFPVCQFPHCLAAGVDVHEIDRGLRVIAYQHRCCWLHLCRPHHDEVGDNAKYPNGRQLAWKLFYDPDGYDLAKVNYTALDITEAVTVRQWASYDKLSLQGEF